MESFVLEHIERAQDAGLHGSYQGTLASGGSPRSEGIVEDLAQRMALFHARFRAFFVTRTRNVIEQSKKYLFGLIQSEKRNMERMAEVVPDSNDQVYQHFITNSPWSGRAVLDQIAWDVDKAFGDSEDCFLVVDESAFAKKGKKSVGVARQWNGRQGKIDNCQVGVFTAFGCGGEVTLIDERLYLSKQWVDDPKRCERAQIPVEERVFRSKAQLALEMVGHARGQGVGHRWVGMDAGYGKEPWLLRALDQEGEIWVADVLIAINWSIWRTRARSCPSGEARKEKRHRDRLHKPGR